ncbi:MAG: PA14 domain-containing protein [Kiritimatiellaeota bacterium]|nr:PA14 domain-containing protein [Kiritimatiellota bacterium]
MVGGKVQEWPNMGSQGGVFTNVTANEGPALTTYGAANTPAVYFSGESNGARNNNSILAGMTPDPAITGRDSWTMEAWINVPVLPTYTTTYFAWTFRGASSDGQGGPNYRLFEARYSSDGNAIEHHSDNVTWGTKPPQNQWHHVVLTRDGASRMEYVYVNGVQTAAVSKPNVNILPDGIFTIGATQNSNRNGWEQQMSGYIGQIRVHTGFMPLHDAAVNYAVERGAYGRESDIAIWDNPSTSPQPWADAGNWFGGIQPSADVRALIPNGGSASLTAPAGPLRAMTVTDGELWLSGGAEMEVWTAAPGMPFYVADAMGATGTLNVVEGLLGIRDPNTVGQFIIGNAADALGTVNIGGGALPARVEVSREIYLGSNLGTMGRITVLPNGTLTRVGDVNSGYARVGRDRGDGKLTVNGGTILYPRLTLVSNGGKGVLEMNDGFVRLSDMLYFSDNTGYADSEAIAYLNGGVLQLTRINTDKTDGLNAIYFNGTVVRNISTQGDFINNANMTNLFVQAGGAIFDVISDNKRPPTEITLQRALLHDPALGATVDGGLVKRGPGLLRLSGAGHTFTGDIHLEEGLLFFSRADLMPGYAGEIIFDNPNAVVGCTEAGAVPWLLSLIDTGATGYLAVFSENVDDDIDLSTHPYLKLATRGGITLNKPVVTAPGAPLNLGPLHGSTLTYTHPITNTMALVVSGQGNGTLVLDNTGANDYTGGTTITGGRVRLDNLAQLGTGMITLAGEGGLLINANTIDPVALLARITAGSRGHILINGAAPNMNFNLSGHPGIYLGTADNDRTYGGTLTPSGDTYRAAGGWQEYRLQSARSGISLQNLTDDNGTPRHLVIEDEGTARILNASTFSGGIAVTNKGGLWISNNSYLLANATSLYINDGTLRLADGMTIPARVAVTAGPEGMEVNPWGNTCTTFAGALTGTGCIFTSDGGDVYFGDVSAFAGVFDPRENGSTLGVGAGLTFGWNPSLVITNSGFGIGYLGIQYDGNLTWSTDLVTPLGADGLNVGLKKRGAGTLSVDVAHTYNGNTIVDQGTLKVDHDNALPAGVGKGKVSISFGAALDVNGRDIAVNGIINPGIVTDGLGGAQTVTVGVDDTSSTLTARLDPALTLVKEGVGTTTLASPEVHDVRVKAGTVTMTLPAGIKGDFTLEGSGIVTVNGNAPTGGASAGQQGLTAYYYQMANNSLLNENLMPTLGALDTFFYSNSPTNVTDTALAGDTLDFGFTQNTCRFPAPYDESRADNFIAIYRGTFTAEESGTYTFGVQADDFGVVFIDGVNVVNHTTSTTKTGTIPLSAGEHDIAIGFYERGGEQGLNILMQAPSDASLTPLPQVLLTSAAPAVTARLGGVDGPAATQITLNGSAVAGIGTDDGRTATFSGTVVSTATATLRKVGPGRQILDNAQALTLGYIDTTEGTLEIAVPGNAPAFVSSYIGSANPNNNFTGVTMASLTGGAPGGVLQLNEDGNLRMNRATADTTFNGSIVGPASAAILKADLQVLTLAGDNDGFLGTWLIHAGSTLNLADGGTLGTGPVVNNGELRFTRDEDYAVTLWGGTGTVVKCSEGTLYVRSVGNAPITQPFTIEGGRVVFDTQGGSLFLNGALDVSEGASWGVTGGGRVIVGNSGELPPSHVTIDGTEWSVIANDSPPVEDGLTVMLDASNPGTLTVDGNGSVSQWLSLAGASVYTNSDTASSPFYVPEAFGGKGGVVFGTNELSGAYAPTWLSSSQQTVVQTVFLVTRMTANQVDNAGIFGQTGADKGIRCVNNSTGLRVSGYDVNDFINGGSCYVNGALKSDNGALDTVPVLIMQNTGNVWTGWLNPLYTTLGFYWCGQTLHLRYYRGEVGELLVYNRQLPGQERELIEAYLMDKWLTPGQSSEIALPEGLTIEISNGGILNLNGSSQTVSTVIAGEGGGSVINGTLTVTDALVITLLPDGSTAGLVSFDNLVLGPNARLIVNGMEYAKGVIDVFTATTVSPATPFAKENLPKAWSGNFRNNLYRISHGATLIILR